MKTTSIIVALAVSAFSTPSGRAQEVQQVNDPFPAGAVVAADAQPVEVAGTLTGMAGGSVLLRTETGLNPVQYHLTQTTQWVDEAGNVVTRESVQTGAPVRLFYTRTPEGLVASKVIVRPRAVVAPEPLAPIAAERDVTTERTETAVERAPVVTEKREVIRERRAPVVVERPTIVERPAPILKQESTTTTTTTTKKDDDDDDDDD
jgi:hypothetical protein